MSNYGNPPSDPYGQNPQDPTGSSPQNAYGQAPQAGYGAPEGGTFAPWLKRVGAYLIDMLLTALAQILYIIGLIMALNATEVGDYNAATGQYDSVSGFTGLPLLLMGVGLIMGLAFFVWNTCLKQGNTGYSIGKGIMGIKLVKAETGQPVGAGMAFVRSLAHILDAIPCYIGFFWPLWDAKRQTFADKIIGTYVIDQPKG